MIKIYQFDVNYKKFGVVGIFAHPNFIGKALGNRRSTNTGALNFIFEESQKDFGESQNTWPTHLL